MRENFYLDVMMDRHLTMEKQVNTNSKACYYHLRNIGRIRQHITDGACKTLVQALITLCLDYANALLYGVPLSMFAQLGTPACTEHGSAIGH